MRVGLLRVAIFPSEQIFLVSQVVIEFSTFFDTFHGLFLKYRTFSYLFDEDQWKKRGLMLIAVY